MLIVLRPAMRRMGRAAFCGAAAALLLAAACGATESTYRDALATARREMDKGEFVRAENTMSAAVRTYPNNPDVHALYAEILLRLGNSPKAEDEARLAAWHDGNDDEIAPVLAESLLEQDKLSDLIQDVPPGQRAMQAEAAVRRALALAHIEMGDVATGEALLDDSRRLDPDSQATHIGMARLDLAQHDLAGADRELAAARKTNPDAIDVLRLAADIMRAKGNAAGALVAYDKALSEHPDDITLMSSRAMVLISVGRLDDARRDVDAALAEAPFSLTPNFLNGVLLARGGKLREAEGVLNGISGSFVSLPDGFYVLGAVQYELGEYDSAIYNLTQYVGRRPDELAVRLLLATASLKKGDPTRAIETLSPMVYAKDPDRRAITLLAQAYVAANRKDDAIELFQRLAQAKPDDPKPGTEAAIAELGLGDLEQGTAALQKIVTTDSGLAEAGPIYVMTELQFGRLATAEKAALRLVAEDDRNLVSQFMLGLVRTAELRYDDAEAIFQRIVDRDPTFYAAQYNLAEDYAASGEPQKAEQIYTALLKSEPGDETALRGLGELAARTDDLAKAKEWFAQAEAQAPNDPSPGMRLVAIEAQAKDWADAVALARTLAGQFQSPDAVALLASTLAQSGNVPDAIGAIEDFMGTHGHTVAMDRLLASFEERTGDLDGARRSLNDALSLAPDDEAAITDLVDLDEVIGGTNRAVATARSFSVREPELSYVLAADMLAKAGRRGDAIALLKEGEIYHPSPRIAGRLAELTFDSGQHDAAEAMLRKLAKDGTDVASLLALANMDMIDRNTAEAESLYEKVVAEAPNEALALNNLASLYEAQNDPRAFDVALQAYRLTPSAQTADTLGWALVEHGEAARAVPYLERSAADQPRIIDVQYHLAVALAETGATDRARTIFQQIVAANDPAFAGTADARRRLQELEQGKPRTPAL